VSSSLYILFLLDVINNAIN